MTSEEFKLDQLATRRFPMLAYPKNQKWDGKDMRTMKTISIKNIEELEEMKDSVFLDWKDLLKKPEVKKQLKKSNKKK